MRKNFRLNFYNNNQKLSSVSNQQESNHPKPCDYFQKIDIVLMNAVEIEIVTIYIALLKHITGILLLKCVADILTITTRVGTGF